MAIANLALRFIVEFVGVGAVAYWGLQTGPDGIGGIALAIGASLPFVAVWAIVVAPKATNPLTQPQRNAIGTGLLILAAVALALAGEPMAAAIFGAVVVLNWLLLMVQESRVATALRSAGGR